MIEEKEGRTLTPMLVQYLDIKKQYPDSILFYRMGDFYEMFFEDAEFAAPILEVTLTSRDKRSPHPIPMAGVPYHAAQTYVQKLIRKGHKVAICEQVGDPKESKGLVKREVVRVITPSLVGDPELVPEETRNFLISVADLGNTQTEVCSLELLGGVVRLGTLSNEKELRDLLIHVNPKELLITQTLSDRKWFQNVLKQAPPCLVTTRSEYFESDKEKSPSYQALLSYLKETQKIEKLDHLSVPLELVESNTLLLDNESLSALEIIKSRTQESPSLYDTLNATHTPMGRRLLKDWLLYPLTCAKSIEERLNCVSSFVEEDSISEAMRTHLRSIRDLERLATKSALGLALPRDILAIKTVLSQIPGIKKTLTKSNKAALVELATELTELRKLTSRLNKALEDEVPVGYREGGIFKASFHPKVSEYRSLSQNAKEKLAQMEESERKRTGIPNLKIKFNKVFGYTIEISKSHLSKVPKNYTRKQTLSTGERYVTEDLKHFEDKVLSAESKLKKLEDQLVLELRDEVALAVQSLIHNSKALGKIDVLLSFASISKAHHYHRPTLHADWDLEIIQGRHPVVEQRLAHGEFVPNDTLFTKEDCKTVLLTGPNMAGKSTIMRQVALICLMAQAGCFVPATKANLPIVDSIFTRIGSSDDLSQGLSTFMVEMSEVARILSKATSKSLILVDEIGRGTSTYDGLSLAWSILEYLHNQVSAKTLFATHFHELTALEKHFPKLVNMNVLVEKWEDEIVFLHKLAPGICNQSYGIEVARLAKLPPELLQRAQEILGHLESASEKSAKKRSRALDDQNNQLGFFG